MQTKLVGSVSKPVRLFLIAGTLALSAGATLPQSHTKLRRASVAAICGNPQATCKTSVTFQPHDLPFRVPANAVIIDTDLFYAVILKSMAAGVDNCEAFIAESDRLAAQALFPDHKVFASRCTQPGELFYTNVNENQRMMAVYAGATLPQAKRVLAAVQATGKFPGANLRRMRTGFNGT
jgi:hypothetical protein